MSNAQTQQYAPTQVKVPQQQQPEPQAVPHQRQPEPQPQPQAVQQPSSSTTQQQQGPVCKLDRNSGALDRDEYGKFVQFFRQASPYIEGHRARTFVVVIPGR